MKKKVKRRRATQVVIPPQPPKHTGYGLMVLAIAILGIVILLLNISEGKRDIQKQDIVMDRLVTKYKADILGLHAHIAELESQLSSCQESPAKQVT